MTVLTLVPRPLSLHSIACSATFLPNCAAPQPFIIGVTPAQFAAVNDELQLGDIV